jgi:hypothetical protein
LTAITDLLRFLFDLLKPSSHLLIVWVVGLLLFVVNRKRVALRCLAIGPVLLLIYTLPPLPRFLMGRLESTYPPFSVVPSDALTSWKNLGWLDELMKEQLAHSLGPQC